MRRLALVASKIENPFINGSKTQARFRQMIRQIAKIIFAGPNQRHSSLGRRRAKSCTRTLRHLGGIQVDYCVRLRYHGESLRVPSGLRSRQLDAKPSNENPCTKSAALIRELPIAPRLPRAVDEVALLMTQSAPLAEFRIAPELRRCCYYWIVGTLIIDAGIYYALHVVAGRPFENLVAGWVVSGIAALATIVPLRWKLRVDGQGIRRHLLFRWDLWSWDDMASGRLKKTQSHTILDPARPWWRRTLTFGFMTPENIQIVVKAINAHYQLPAPPELPERLKIKYGFRRSAMFDQDGVHFRIKGLEKAYPWRDVQNVFIIRVDPLRRDFWSMQIILPDEEMEFKFITHQHGTSPSWRGASAELINEFLHHHVQIERISVAISGEPIANREQLERKLRELEKSGRSMRVMAGILLILIPSFLLWIWITASFAGALAMGALLALPSPAVIWVYRLHRARIKELKSQLDSQVLKEGKSEHALLEERISETISKK